MKSPKHAKPQAHRKNAAGVPVFEDDAELWALFCRQPDNAAPSFGELMDDISPDVAALALHKGVVFTKNAKMATPAPLRRSGKTLVPEDQIDLHGLTVSQATRRVRIFLTARQQQGLGLVRVITGKGLHSNGPAVLPAAIEDLARELQMEKKIAGFWWESGRKETSGAILVRL